MFQRSWRTATCRCQPSTTCSPFVTGAWLLLLEARRPILVARHTQRRRVEIGATCAEWWWLGFSVCCAAVMNCWRSERGAFPPTSDRWRWSHLHKAAVATGRRRQHDDALSTIVSRRHIVCVVRARAEKPILTRVRPNSHCRARRDKTVSSRRRGRCEFGITSPKGPFTDTLLR